MTQDETRFLLARFSRCWGRRPPDPATLSEWTRFLEDIPAETAHQKLDQLVNAGHPGPSLAEFIAHCKAGTQRHESYPQQVEDEPLATKERALEHIARIRDELDARFRHPSGSGMMRP